MSEKQIIGDPIVIGGRQLSLSRAIRAGDFVFLTGQVPFKNGQVIQLLRSQCTHHIVNFLMPLVSPKT